MWFSSFWNTFGYLNNSKINDLVRDNASIEEFLDEENILTDVKQASTKFAKHLVKNPEKLKKLIDYCIQEQDIIQTEGSDMGKCVKYPFLSSEIFSTQPPKIAEFLLGEYELSDDEEEQDKEKSDSKENNSFKDDLDDEEEKDVEDQVKEEEEKKDEKEKVEGEKEEEEQKSEKKAEENNDVENKEEKKDEKVEETKEPSITGPEIMTHLFSFLEKEEKCEHFSTSAGYFSKIVALLLRKQSNMWEYFIKNPQIQKNFLKHIDDRSIADLVLQMINNTAGTTNYWSTEEPTPDQFVENKKQLIEELISLFESSENQETLENISFILSEIYSNYISQGETSSSTNTDLALPISGKSSQILFKKLKSSDSYIVFCAASILNYIFQLEVINEESKALKTTSEEDKPNPAQEVECEIVITKTQMVEQLLESLQVEPKIEPHQTQYGATQKPFGLGRMKILEIFTSIIKLNNKEFNEAIEKSNFYGLIIKYFKENEWNNLLHCTVEKIFQNTLENNTSLLVPLFEQTQLSKTIIDGSALNDKSKPVEEQPNKSQPGEFQNYISRGNVGFLTKFANMFLEKKEELESVQEHFNKNAEWKEFEEKSLKETNELEKERELGGSSSVSKEPAETSIDIIKIYEKLNQYFTKPQGEVDDALKNYDNENDDDENDYNENDQNYKRNKVLGVAPDVEYVKEETIEETVIESVKEVPLQAQENNWIKEEMKTLNSFDSSQYWKNVPAYGEDDIDKLMNE